MSGCVIDTHHAQVVPEGSSYVFGAVVAEQPGPVCYHHMVRACPVHSFLDHLYEGVDGNVPLKPVGQNETRVVINGGDQVVVAPAHHPEVGGLGGSHLVGAGTSTAALLGCSQAHLRPLHQTPCAGCGRP